MLSKIYSATEWLCHNLASNYCKN